VRCSDPSHLTAASATTFLLYMDARGCLRSRFEAGGARPGGLGRGPEGPRAAGRRPPRTPADWRRRRDRVSGGGRNPHPVRRPQEPTTAQANLHHGSGAACIRTRERWHEVGVVARCRVLVLRQGMAPLLIPSRVAGSYVRRKGRGGMGLVDSLHGHGQELPTVVYGALPRHHDPPSTCWPG
jgi:hypothetical protein